MWGFPVNFPLNQCIETQLYNSIIMYNQFLGWTDIPPPGNSRLSTGYNGVPVADSFSWCPKTVLAAATNSVQLGSCPFTGSWWNWSRPAKQVKPDILFRMGHNDYIMIHNITTVHHFSELGIQYIWNIWTYNFMIVWLCTSFLFTTSTIFISH